VVRLDVFANSGYISLRRKSLGDKRLPVIVDGEYTHGKFGE